MSAVFLYHRLVASDNQTTFKTPLAIKDRGYLKMQPIAVDTLDIEVNHLFGQKGQAMWSDLWSQAEMAGAKCETPSDRTWAGGAGW